MELENEIALDGSIYCFEDSLRVAEAKAWIADNSGNTADFRLAFPDASHVSTHPLGLDTRMDI